MHGILKDLHLFIVGVFLLVCCMFWVCCFGFFFSFLGGNTRRVFLIVGEAFLGVFYKTVNIACLVIEGISSCVLGGIEW